MIMSESMNEEARRAALESVRKDANDPTLSVGDIVLCGGVYAAVTDIQVWGPGQHGNSPIRNDWTAVQVVTDMGTSRWHGREPQSGYMPCACRDCIDTTVSSDWTAPELCSECADAGCEPGQSESDAYDCQRDDAYDSAAVHIHVGHNIPGYLPEGDVTCFDNVADALDALRHAIKDQGDYYAQGCESSNFVDDCECAWCDVARDTDAALSAIADGDATPRLLAGGTGWIFRTPEGPDMSHWATLIATDLDDCEIFAEQGE